VDYYYIETPRLSVLVKYIKNVSMLYHLLNDVVSE